jgi:acyl-CoA thioesterase YciA
MSTGEIKNPAIRVMMLPKDTNYRGTIFGGVILSYLDLAGAVEAQRLSPKNFVTVSMHEVVFESPVHVGDLVSFYPQVLKVGRTSVTIHVDVYAKRQTELDKPEVKVTAADIVYVGVDSSGKPVPVY